MIALLGACGLGVIELAEVRPSADATTKSTSVALHWARRHPCEELWRVRRRV
jgi:hypothetical protein